MLSKKDIIDRKILLALIIILCLYLNYYYMHKYPRTRLIKHERLNCKVCIPDYYSSEVGKKEI